MNKIGFVFFAGALAVLIGRFVYPNIITNEVLPVAIVLVIMGGMAGFPEEFMKIMNPGLGNIQNDLQTHLTNIGVEATVMDPKGPDVIQHKLPLFGNDPLYVPPMAVVKVYNRNIEFVETRAMVIPGAGGRSVTRGGGWKTRVERADAMGVQTICAVRGDIKDEGLCKASTAGGGVWSGGRLADALNSDSELKTMLMPMSYLPITVRGIKSDGYVAIYKSGSGALSGDSMVPTFGMGEYPSSEEFKIYDKIAGHVKETLKA